MNIEKIREALEECRNQIEVPGTTYTKVVAAIAELDKAQPGKVDKLIEAGDAIASEVEGRQSIERMMSEQFDLSKDARESHAIRAERMRRRLAAWTAAKSTTAQPAKVLTDDVIDKLCNEYAHLYAREIRRVLERVRDNGYLAPAPVDIERIMEVFSRFAGEHVSILHHDFLADSEDILRTRLTNALAPKP